MKKRESLKKTHENIYIINNLDMSDYNKFKIEQYKKINEYLKKYKIEEENNKSKKYTK